MQLQRLYPFARHLLSPTDSGSLFHSTVWSSGLRCERMIFPSHCRFGVCNYWKLRVVCCSETHLPNPPSSIHVSLILPCLSVWHLETEHWQAFSPPSCHTCWVHEKPFFAACFMCRLPQVFYLWTVRCWHQIAFQMFPEECILSAVVSAVGRHVSRAIPKLALIPAAFKSSLSLVGQNWLSMGHLTAGMLSVQFPTPRQYWDFLEVLFSVGWPLT